MISSSIDLSAPNERLDPISSRAVGRAIPERMSRPFFSGTGILKPRAE